MTKTADDYIKERLQAPKAFYEWCYYYMPTYIWKNKKETIIASERDHYFTTEKRLTKNSRLTFFDSYKYFMIVLSTSKRIEIQTYMVSLKFENGVQKFSTKIVNLEQFSQNQHVKIGGNFPNGYKFGLKALGGLFYSYIPDVYPSDWLTRLARVSELKYLTLENIFPDQLERIYKYRNRIEYAQAIGAERLADEIIHNQEQIDMRKVTMNWLKKNKGFVKNSKYGYKECLLKQALEERGGKLIPGIEKYLNYKQVELIPVSLGTVKFQNYLIKQDAQFSFYSDYLTMLQDLNIASGKASLLPSDLRKAHDKAVDILNAMERKIVQTGYKEQAVKKAFMEMTIDNFTFVLPKSADELVQEGENLHHCVGSSRYINAHAKGKSTILFIRQNNKLKQSYFTMEYSNNRVMQVQGKRNRENVPKPLRQAIDTWLNVIQTKRKQSA